jgi:hypothetical protein
MEQIGPRAAALTGVCAAVEVTQTTKRYTHNYDLEAPDLKARKYLRPANDAAGRGTW